MGFAQYGSETSGHPLAGNVDVDVTTSNNIFFMHLFGRIEQDFGFLVPYAEGLVGFSYLSTESEIEDVADTDGDPVSDTHFEDWTSNNGLGGGVKIELTEFENEDDSYFGSTRLYLDLKVRYMFGGEAEYLREGDITRPDPFGPLVFTPSNSETDFITYQIGVVFHLY